jgi:hypothetical protein
LKPSEAVPSKKGANQNMLGLSQKNLLGASQINLLGTSQKNFLGIDSSSSSWFANYNSQSFSFRQMDFYDSDEESDVTDDDANVDEDLDEKYNKLTF